MCDCSDSITNGAAPTTVGPNLTLSNLYAGNVFTNFISVSNIAIPGSPAIPGYVLGTTGTSIAWVSGGGGGSSQWTGTVGNPIYYANPVGIGSPSTPTATLMVTGNIYASNSLTTTSIISSGITSIYGPVNVNGVPVITAVNTITGLTAIDRVNCSEPYFVNASASSAFSLYKRVVYTNFFVAGAAMQAGCPNPTTGKYYTFDTYGNLYTTDENGFLIGSSTQWFAPGSSPSTTLRYYNGLLFACDSAVDQQVFYINAPDNPMVTSGALSGVFTIPADLFIDKSGKIFVADSGAQGVWIFQSYLDTSPTFVPITFPSGMIVGPFCICGDSLGYLYVTLGGAYPTPPVAIKIDQTGTILATYASPNPNSGTNFVTGLAVDNFFNVYIGDSPTSATFGQIHKFLNDGTHVAFITLDTVSLYTIIYEPSSDKLIYFWAYGFDILFTESQIYGKGNTSYIGITGTSLDLSGSDASRPTLKVTGNVYSSNSLTTTNVIATRFYGDGGFLSNIASGGFTQPLANLVVSNSVTTTNITSTSLVVTGAMTSNVSNTTLFYDTLTIPYVNTLQLTAPSIISTGGISRFSNLIVSNTVTTSEIICNAFTTSTATNWNYISNAASARSTSVGWEGIRQVFGDRNAAIVYVYNNAVLETTLSYVADGFGTFVAVGGLNDEIIVVSGVNSFYVYNFDGLAWNGPNIVDTTLDMGGDTLWMPSLSAENSLTITLVIGGYGYNASPGAGNQGVGVYKIRLLDGSTSYFGTITPQNAIPTIYRDTVAISGDGKTIAIGQQDSSILYVYSITDLDAPVFSDTTGPGSEYYVSIDYYGQVVLLTLQDLGQVLMYSISLSPV